MDSTQIRRSYPLLLETYQSSKASNNSAEIRNDGNALPQLQQMNNAVVSQLFAVEADAEAEAEQHKQQVWKK